MRLWTGLKILVREIKVHWLLYRTAKQIPTKFSVVKRDWDLYVIWAQDLAVIEAIIGIEPVLGVFPNYAVIYKLTNIQRHLHEVPFGRRKMVSDRIMYVLGGIRCRLRQSKKF